jgi:glycosyltransferase 2 family protein
MSSSIKNILQYVFFLGLGLFLLWLTTRNLTTDQIAQLKNTLRDARFSLILPVMLLMLTAHYSRALRWKILMEPLGFQPTNLNTFFAVMLGYFFNLLVPRLGEVMKCTMLARYEKTPVDKLIGTMVAERAIDFICLLLIIFVTLFIQMDTLGDYARQELGRIFLKNGHFAWGRMALLLAVSGGALAGVIGVLRRYAHVGFIGKINDLVKGVWQGLTSVRFVKRKAAFILHTLFIWTVYLLCVRLGFLALEPVSHLGFRPSFTILTFGSLAMIATQGGIGAYQLAVQKTLTLYGINEVNGLAYGWLLWAFQTVLVLVIGLLCLLFLPLINRKPHDAHTTDSREDIQPG